MARTINEIKAEMCREFMNNEAAAARYGFNLGSPFGDWFKAGSVENMFLYIFAVAAYVVERLMDEHRAEVSEEIDAIIPHRPKWYRDKVLAFMVGRELEPDADTYDLTGMGEQDIEAARIVKHAVAVENKEASILTIKVAGENNGTRGPLAAEEAAQLEAYIHEIKDAGVRTDLVNKAPDVFNCTVDIYYNALLRADDVKAAATDAIRSYIENLPFNGEFTNMALVDALQAVEGCRVVELRGSSAQAEGEATDTPINARLTPAAGYFRPGSITVNMIAYDEA